jgi:Fic family protein
MHASRLGRHVSIEYGSETVRAFVPPALPPIPAIAITPLLDSLVHAERALGRLDGIAIMLPDHELFLFMYVRKEALLSSQIEGTQSTLSDLLRFETEAASGHPINDIREVSNYVRAIMHGLERVETLPLSLRLIREMHEVLMQDSRGGTKGPGNFRCSQNWIGGTRPGNALFVPPPIDQLDQCLNELELFMHESASGLPVLIKAGLIHVQFETIHPFQDGNGRIGRLLITLYLCINGVLRKPLLYLSLFLKAHRTQYYDLLQQVRETGDWEAWLVFFLNGVAETANQAFDAANRINTLFQSDRTLISNHGGKRAGSILRVHEVLQRNPYTTAQLVAEQTKLSMPTTNAVLGDMERLGLIREVTGKLRGRVFCYEALMKILSEGTEPLPR